MDLNELRVLENKIDTLTKEKQDLIDRQMEVVIHHKFFTGTLKPTRNNKVRVTGLKMESDYSNDHINGY